MRSMSVLIVDDDANVRHLLRRFIAGLGYEIVEAATAEDALRLVEACAPAVAFCDIHMPGANGLWLADQIRCVSPSTAMVLATGDSEVPANESLRSGVVAYLVKPLAQPDVLLALADGMRWSSDARSREVQPRRTRTLSAASGA